MPGGGGTPAWMGGDRLGLNRGDGGNGGGDGDTGRSLPSFRPTAVLNLLGRAAPDAARRDDASGGGRRGRELTVVVLGDYDAGQRELVHGWQASTSTAAAGPMAPGAGAGAARARVAGGGTGVPGAMGSGGGRGGSNGGRGVPAASSRLLGVDFVHMPLRPGHEVGVHDVTAVNVWSFAGCHTPIPTMARLVAPSLGEDGAGGRGPHPQHPSHLAIVIVVDASRPWDIVSQMTVHTWRAAALARCIQSGWAHEHRSHAATLNRARVHLHDAVQAAKRAAGGVDGGGGDGRPNHVTWDSWMVSPPPLRPGEFTLNIGMPLMFCVTHGARICGLAAAASPGMSLPGGSVPSSTQQVASMVDLLTRIKREISAGTLPPLHPPSRSTASSVISGADAIIMRLDGKATCSLTLLHRITSLLRQLQWLSDCSGVDVRVVCDVCVDGLLEAPKRMAGGGGDEVGPPAPWPQDDKVPTLPQAVALWMESVRPYLVAPPPSTSKAGMGDEEDAGPSLLLSLDPRLDMASQVASPRDAGLPPDWLGGQPAHRIRPDRPHATEHAVLAALQLRQAFVELEPGQVACAMAAVRAWALQCGAACLTLPDRVVADDDTPSTVVTCADVMTAWACAATATAEDVAALLAWPPHHVTGGDGPWRHVLPAFTRVDATTPAPGGTIPLLGMYLPSGFDSLAHIHDALVTAVPKPTLAAAAARAGLADPTASAGGSPALAALLTSPLAFACLMGDVRVPSTHTAPGRISHHGLLALPPLPVSLDIHGRTNDVGLEDGRDAMHTTAAVCAFTVSTLTDTTPGGGLWLHTLLRDVLEQPPAAGSSQPLRVWDGMNALYHRAMVADALLAGDEMGHARGEGGGMVGGSSDPALPHWMYLVMARRHDPVPTWEELVPLLRRMQVATEAQYAAWRAGVAPADVPDAAGDELGDYATMVRRVVAAQTLPTSTTAGGSGAAAPTTATKPGVSATSGAADTAAGGASTAVPGGRAAVTGGSGAGGGKKDATSFFTSMLSKNTGAPAAGTTKPAPKPSPTPDASGK